MASTKRNGMFVGLGLLLAPLTILKVATTIVGTGGPAAAQGASTDSLTSENQASLVISARSEVSPKQRGAFQYVESLRHEGIGASPFAVEVEADMALSNDDQRPTDAAPRCQVSAIMVSGSVASALIDGKLLRVGDHIADSDWIVAMIDNETHAVEIEHPGTGRRETRRVRFYED